MNSNRSNTRTTLLILSYSFSQFPIRTTFFRNFLFEDHEIRMRLLEMAYEKAAANKSLSNLFQLSFESLTSTSTAADKELGLALDPSSKECKKWAWLGDAFLSNELSRLIYEKEQEASLEKLHQSRERYKTNEALALYLERAASAAYQIIQERSLSMGSLTPFNKHSVATCFEALLHLTTKRY